MPFKDLTAKYKEAMKHKIREHTWKTKNNIIDQKILPYFGEKKVCEITADDVTDWQNMIQDQRDKDNPFSPTYLKSIHNQSFMLSPTEQQFLYGMFAETYPQDKLL